MSDESGDTDVERSNRIVSRLSQDPRVQQIVADARLYDSLRAEPGWQRLFAMTQAKKARWMESITKRLMGPKKHWPKDDEIAYYQGFYQGAIFVLAHPEHAEQNLERAARVAWAMSFEDDQEVEQ